MLTRKTRLIAAAITAATLLPLAAVRPVARAQAVPPPAPSAPIAALSANIYNTHHSIFWYIRHQPASPVFKNEGLFLPGPDKSKRDYQSGDPALYQKGKRLWLQQIASHPQDPVILSNAAQCFTLADEPLAAQFLLQAEKIAPHDGGLYQQLGELYQLQTFHGSTLMRREWAQKALTQLQTAQSLEKNNKWLQGILLTDLAKTAYSAGHYHQAQAYATQLLQHGQENKMEMTGDDFHEANMILGRLALRNGDTVQAESDLLAMGNVSGSPKLDSFGPNMQLAQDLLERGDRQPVLAYFQECARFWKDDNGQLKAWTAQVQQGKIPHFRGNLAY